MNECPKPKLEGALFFALQIPGKKSLAKTNKKPARVATLGKECQPLTFCQYQEMAKTVNFFYQKAPPYGTRLNPRACNIE